jgi:hypothetical protein
MAEIIGGKVLGRAAFGNEAHAIPIVGTDTSTQGYGGTAPPIFVYTGFPVISAEVAFEREFGENDPEIIYRFKDDRSAARIRVRAPIDPDIKGFYVDYGQRPGFNDPFILRFNWMAVGIRGHKRTH